MKPKYTYFYKNDNAVKDILEHPPFTYDTPIRKRITKDRAIIEFEHFDLYCLKMETPMLSMRGHKTWQILIEDDLYKELDNDYIQDVLRPMMCPYELLGGHIVIIDKYCE